MIIKNKKILSFFTLIFLTVLYSFNLVEINTNEESVKTTNLFEKFNSVTENQISVTEDENPEDQKYLVVRVVDGDTIEVEIDGMKKKVRYIGIDTPETEKSARPSECFGIEASERNRELVEGKYVKLEKDINETDKYGRLLRYVYVDGVFINLKLLEEGYAKVATFPPDVRYVDRFKEASSVARNTKKGLWGNICQ